MNSDLFSSMSVTGLVLWPLEGLWENAEHVEGLPLRGALHDVLAIAYVQPK